VRALEERLAALQASLATVTSQNERLVTTLRDARDQIVALKEEVDRLAQPPAGFGVFLETYDDGTADIFTGGRKLRVMVSPSIETEDLHRGQEVMLNEAMNVVAVLGYETVGEVVLLKEVLADGDRALVTGHTDEERVVRIAESLRDEPMRAGDALLLEPRSAYVYEKVPRAEVEELVLEEVPDIDYASIGGLAAQIEQIRDAVELPTCTPTCSVSTAAPAEGVLLYGPPGCGKTLIAKAVANSLAKKVAEVTGQPQGKSYFLNIKGPELLNKYVGETERHIRLVFQRAREKASDGTPVIVFFDEMDSLFRTRGSGRVLRRGEHDRAAAAQRDRRRREPRERHRDRRVEPRGHDRPGDPAPGSARREDQDRAARRRVGARHLLQVPRAGPAAAPGRRRGARRQPQGDRRRHDPAHGRAHVQRDRGEPLPRGDLRQRGQGGSVLQGLQLRRHDPEHRRPRQEDGDQGLPRGRAQGLRISHLLAACVDEFKENEDLPNTTNPDDWARISGKKGERIVYIRTLIQGKAGTEAGRSIDTVANTGQYL
jgi:proteasome-associated ATPase